LTTPERIVYVNGEYVPEGAATVSVFDRGFLFADGVYEVSAVLGGRLVDNQRHLDRLGRSLGELGMSMPLPVEDLVAAQRETVVRNGLVEGALYLQVTRGAGDRDFLIDGSLRPTVVMFTQARPLVDSPLATRGCRVCTVPETRWARRDIKTVQLLPASLAKQAAHDAGYDDAWFVEDGFVTEGSSNNAFIITPDGSIVTRHLGSEILPGITRTAVLEIARDHGMTVEERSFSLDEAYGAAEAFISSATAMVLPVVAIDDVDVGAGVPGKVTLDIRRRYIERAVAEAD
jgi:D-alanine transaminase